MTNKSVLPIIQVRKEKKDKGEKIVFSLLSPVREGPHLNGQQFFQNF